MSTEEDTELKDLLTQALETNGTMAKIRAQLRASVFLALDENEKFQKRQPLLNKRIQEGINTPEGKLMFSLVREFLEYFDMDCTISVYDSETRIGTGYTYNDRNKLIEELNLDVNEAVPVISQLVKKAQGNGTLNNNVANVNGIRENVHARNVTNESMGNETYSVTINQLNGSHEQEEQSDLSCNETNSIAEESISQLNEVSNKHLLDVSIKDFSAPVLKEVKVTKPDKLKTKSNLTSLSDLPPLQQVNKSRSNDTMLLPSLYTRETRNDEFIENPDNYEEDFLSDNEVPHNNSDFVDSTTSKDIELDSIVDDILKSN